MNTLRSLAATLLLALACTSAARAADVALTADAVLARYIDAVGGSAKMAAVQSRISESTLSMGILSMHLKSVMVRPDRFQDSGSMLGIKAGSGYDGTTGWTSKGSKVEVAQGDDLIRLVRGHSLSPDKMVPVWYPQRRLLPDATVDGTATHVVEMTAVNGDKETWRFDAATGLLLQVENFKFEKGKEPVKMVTTISDYRTVDGVRLPFKAVGTDGKKTFTMTVDSLVQNQPTDPIKFPGANP